MGGGQEQNSGTKAASIILHFPGSAEESGVSADRWSVPIKEGRAHPREADKGRNGPGAEGLVGNQCRGFNTGESTVVLGQGAVQEV